MNKILLTISMLALLVLTACAKEEAVACTMDARICPDGSAVGRVGPDCEFEACPSPACNYERDDRKYIGKSGDECSRIRFQCTEGTEYFADECGCGCKPTALEGKLKVTDCTEEQKNTQACTREYLPVCGWSDPAKIQCIKYPCASTYGNKCEACAAENVISWSEGECPTG